jgi:hypothetical protein
MNQNTYLYEKLAEERFKDIQREVAQSRVVSTLPRQHQNFARHVVSDNSPCVNAGASQETLHPSVYVSS